MRGGREAGEVGDVAVVDEGLAALGFGFGGGGAIAAVAEYDRGGRRVCSTFFNKAPLR